MAEDRGEESKELYRMYRIWRTTRQMLKDRVRTSQMPLALPLPLLQLTLLPGLRTSR